MAKKNKYNNNNEDVERIWNDYFEPNNIIFIAMDRVVTSELPMIASQSADGILYDLGLLPENTHALAEGNVISMDEYIKSTYTNELMEKKKKIISEEINNENLYLNSKISTLKNTKKLYLDLFLNKFNDYVKFLTKTVDKYDKVDYLLVNEILSLQKKIDYLKKKINSLLESKKTYNKFIILQIKLKKKTMKLPDYYEFILNHSLQESIEHCMGVLDEEGVKKIYKYKNKVIYKSYDAFNYQFKSYENENREHLTKLGILQRDINRLNFEKKEVIKECNNIEKYFTIYLKI